MKSVFELTGFFLYLGYRVIMLPILSVLMVLLFAVTSVRTVQATFKATPIFAQRMGAAAAALLQKLLATRKLQLNWHLHKAS